MRRRGTSVRPYSETRSAPTTSPRAGSQCGSNAVRSTRSPATDSIHSGSTLAAQRAYSRVVSVSSAARIHFAAERVIPEAGCRKNLSPRAPR